MINMFIQIILMAQQVSMADTMRSEGKIYVVVIIFFVDSLSIILLYV